ncbi:transposable element Tc1 transposase [Trichonephila clavipes]|nr:transposable element Tc1 transposase [Trichonephila clavipes]
MTLETISNYRNSYPGFSSGRPRGTTPTDDRYIVLQARRNRRQTAGEIARHTTQATGQPTSRFTVARRLHGGGLFARRPVRCVPLTPAHRRRRSLWCREHRNWRDNEWGRVLFTDENRFSLSSDSHRILIWRERGSRNHPSNIIERDRYGGRSVLVWGGIMLGSRTDLHIFDAASVNRTRYCNEILLPYVRLFRDAMGLQFLFMDDNAPCHRTVAAEQLLESEDIERMDWPARSPDLNPIEHGWAQSRSRSADGSPSLFGGPPLLRRRHAYWKKYSCGTSMPAILETGWIATPCKNLAIINTVSSEQKKQMFRPANIPYNINSSAKGRPTSFQVKKCVITDDERSASVESPMPKMVSNYRQCKKCIKKGQEKKSRNMCAEFDVPLDIATCFSSFSGK